MLYGPPGVGKLTVARELEARYGLRVLDNHVSIDAALRLFDFGTAPFQRLVEELRVVLFEAAATAGVSVASTLVYRRGVDDDHVATLVRAARETGAHVTRVRLLAPTELLETRVHAADRRGTRKITDPAVLRRMLATFDVSAAFDPGDLTIDTGATAPADAARTIARHTGLTGVDGSAR